MTMANREQAQARTLQRLEQSVLASQRHADTVARKTQQSMSARIRSSKQKATKQQQAQQQLDRLEQERRMHALFSLKVGGCARLSLDASDISASPLCPLSSVPSLQRNRDQVAEDERRKASARAHRLAAKQERQREEDKAILARVCKGVSQPPPPALSPPPTRHLPITSLSFSFFS